MSPKIETAPERRKPSTAFVLGQMLEKLASIEEKLGRLVFRADDAEKRIEKLEIAQALDDNSFGKKAVDKAVWAILGAGGVMILKVAGLWA